MRTKKTQQCLTARETAVEKKQRNGEAREWDQFQILLNVCREAYVNGEIDTDKLCFYVTTVAKEFEGDFLLSIPERGRNRLIGDMLMRAMSERPPKVKKPKILPRTLKTLISGLVKMASEDGYVLARESIDPKGTAYDRVKKILEDMGIEVEPRTIEKYYQDNRT